VSLEEDECDAAEWADGVGVTASPAYRPSVPRASDLLLLDVTPLSLGVETASGIMAVVIPRNTTLPCQKTITFEATTDFQSTVTLRIFEGQHTMARQNNLLREVIVDIPARPIQIAQIPVYFDLDADGILSVTVHKNTEVVTNDKGRLSRDEIESMVAAASHFAGRPVDAFFLAGSSAVSERTKLMSTCITREGTIELDFTLFRAVSLSYQQIEAFASGVSDKAGLAAALLTIGAATVLQSSQPNSPDSTTLRWVLMSALRILTELGLGLKLAEYAGLAMGCTEGIDAVSKQEAVVQWVQQAGTSFLATAPIRNALVVAVEAFRTSSSIASSPVMRQLPDGHVTWNVNFW